MINRKKYFGTFLMILVLVLGLAACSSKPAADGEGTSADQTQTEETASKTKDKNKKPAKTNTASADTSQKVTDLVFPEDDGDTLAAKEPYVAKDAVDAARYAAETAKVTYTYPNKVTDLTLTFDADGSYSFKEDSTFYTKDISLTILAPAGAKVYYTLDGSTPDQTSAEYTGPIKFAAKGGKLPDCYVLRARAYIDGSFSRMAARSYFVGSRLDGRYSTLVFSITGDPDQLINEPEGIFTGKNYENRGRESEREVYIEAWRPDGTSVLSQYGGVRIYGGYSRQASIKSMKLFARKSYDPDNKNFKFSEFGTPRLDGSDKIVKSYDKLVLRNGGNDMQFSYIRDELSQALCKSAGFECYEAVLPAVTYLNGSYYNFYWLHENYCDKYFKEKFGDDAPGEFYVLEGGETFKSDDEDCQDLVDEYNTTYNQLINLDLTNDYNYKRVTDFLDIESYLDFYAWNIALNNWDWPNNNYKCVKYVAGQDDPYQTGMFDGKWKFLVHDMDYSYGLYDSDTTQAKYNTLKVVLSKGHERYSPLFDKLMQREDCRTYFKNKTYEYLNGALSENNIKLTYYNLHASRVQELKEYYAYMSQRARKGDFTIWTDISHYGGYETQILTFAEERAAYVIKYMEELLP